MFSQQQTVILGCFWVTFWPELPKMFSILFENLNSDDMQDDASDMPRLLLKYWEMVEIGLQTDILAHFESFFVYALPLYTLWDTLQDFAKWKTLLRYISVVSFISIAYAVVKFKILKVFFIASVSIKWPLFGLFWALTPSNIVWSGWNFKHRYSPIRKTQCLKNPSKFWIFAQMKCSWSLQFRSILRPNLLPEIKKYC